MKEFNYLSYHTEYSCSGTVSKRMSVNACFSGIFSDIRNDSDIIYIVRLYPGTELSAQEHRSNSCLFTKAEVRNHLRQLTSIYPFEFKITTSKAYKDYACFEVMLHLNGVPATFHKYVLTWLRYMYEYPYNVILKDAYRLKKDPIFRFDSIANIFNVVSNCCPSYVGEGHSVSEDTVRVPLKKSELRKRIQEVSRLNNIYKSLSVEKPKLPDEMRGFTAADAEYWSKESFEDRKPFYMEMYNKIKNKRNQ